MFLREELGECMISDTCFKPEDTRDLFYTEVDVKSLGRISFSMDIDHASITYTLSY